MDQVLPFVHANFRTDRSRMAIAGLSMGGWGALALGQRYYGPFRSISSYSGPADCNPATLDGAAVAGAIWACPGFDAVKYWPTSNLPGATWGADLYPEIAKGYNPIDNVGTYRDKRVFLRTGDGPWFDFFDGLEDHPDIWSTLQAKLEQIGADIIENAVHPNLERFAGALGEAGIDHDFDIAHGATPNWDLWRDNLAEDLPGMMAALNARRLPRGLMPGACDGTPAGRAARGRAPQRRLTCSRWPLRSSCASSSAASWVCTRSARVRPMVPPRARPAAGPQR